MLQHRLIEECKRNQRKAQSALYEKYCEGMYRVARRFFDDALEAEDAMQEAFIKAFGKLDQFNGEVSFGAWLKRIVVNQCLDKIKARKMELVALNEELMRPVEEEEDWEIDGSIGIAEVKKSIQCLPEKYRYPLMLFLMEGYDHSEISEILNITPVASRTLVFRGKKKLQEELKMKSYGTGY